MTLQSSTLRPGLLVSFSASVKGNVHYDKVDIERDHKTASGVAKAKWETTRTIADPEEFERAQETASKARSRVRGVCSYSAFGLLCPEKDADELEEAIRDARAMADEFNRTASLTRVNVYVLTGRIAQDDVEAVRAINSEVRELMDEMSAGVKNLDVKVIRAAAVKAKQLGQMLSPEAEARVQLAVDTARRVAKDVVKAGETAAIEIDRRAIRKISEQRTAFLDFSDDAAMQSPRLTGRALDLAAGE